MAAKKTAKKKTTKDGLQAGIYRVELKITKHIQIQEGEFSDEHELLEAVRKEGTIVDHEVTRSF